MYINIMIIRRICIIIKMQSPRLPEFSNLRTWTFFEFTDFVNFRFSLNIIKLENYANIRKSENYANIRKLTNHEKNIKTKFHDSIIESKNYDTATKLRVFKTMLFYILYIISWLYIAHSLVYKQPPFIYYIYPPAFIYPPAR
jgi:hypothetical protein